MYWPLSHQIFEVQMFQSFLQYYVQNTFFSNSLHTHQVHTISTDGDNTFPNIAHLLLTNQWPWRERERERERERVHIKYVVFELGTHCKGTVGGNSSSTFCRYNGANSFRRGCTWKFFIICFTQRSVNERTVSKFLLRSIYN